MLIGAGGITALRVLVWRIGLSRLHELFRPLLFQGFLLAVTAIGLAMLFADDSVRTRLFKGRWRYVVICWVPLYTISLVASVLLTGNVTPLVWALSALAGLVVSLVILWESRHSRRQLSGMAVWGARDWATGHGGWSSELAVKLGLQI